MGGTANMSNKIHVKTGDEVKIISGKDKGKTGKVIAVSPSEGKVIVEKCNMVTYGCIPCKIRVSWCYTYV